VREVAVNALAAHVSIVVFLCFCARAPLIYTPCFCYYTFVHHRQTPSTCYVRRGSFYPAWRMCWSALAARRLSA
jgi:hypothetical protein